MFTMGGAVQGRGYAKWGGAMQSERGYAKAGRGYAKVPFPVTG